MSYSHLSFLGTTYHWARGWFFNIVYLLQYLFVLMYYINRTHCILPHRKLQSPKFTLVKCRCMWEKQSLQMMCTNKLPNYSRIKKICFRNSVNFFPMLMELNWQAWCVLVCTNKDLKIFAHTDVSIIYFLFPGLLYSNL